MQKILLIGAGALARDMITSFGIGRFCAAYVDPAYAPDEPPYGIKLVSDWREAAREATHFVLAIADMAQRARMVSQATEAGLQAADALIVEDARLASDVIIGKGSVVGHFAAVGPGARLMEHVLVMHGCTVGHDTQLAANVVLCSGVRTGGYSAVGRDCFIGPNAVVSPHVKVGAQCHVAAGAVCFRNVPDERIAIGNPARLSTAWPA